MTIEDHIWNLATKKLANEASEKELDELDTLLLQHPHMSRGITQLFHWWLYDDEQTVTDKSELLFSRIKQKIKQAEENGKFK